MNRLWRRPHGIVWAGLCVAGVLAARQSGIQAVPDHPGRFAPLTVYLPRSRGLGPSAAEARVMKTQLDSLVAIVRRTPVLADPRGFETSGSETVADDELPESQPGWQPVRGSLLVIPLLFYKRCDSCRVERNGEGVGAQVGVNDMRLLMPGSGRGGCGGPRVFTAPREVSRVGGNAMYDNGVVVVSARDVVPFIPVSRDEWITAQVNASKNQYGCNRADPRQQVYWDSVRSAWTPEQRAMTAYEIPPGPRPPGPFQLVAPPGTPRARAYVRVNPALFDSTIARTSMQTVVLTVSFPRRDPRQVPRGVRPPLPCSQPIARSSNSELDQLAIHEGIWCNLDWNAVRGLLR